MDYESVILFAIATCVTPGPNNVMLMSSGVNFGIKRTMRHVIGVNVGFSFMLIVAGWGAGAFFSVYPIFYSILRVVSIGYLIYLSYCIAINSIADFSKKSGSPLGVINAALFQWVNPKAWIMCIGAVSTFVDLKDSYYFQVVMIACIFLFFGVPCSVLWVFCGNFFKSFFDGSNALRIFNISMGVLLMVSLVPEILELYNSTVKVF